jgi:mono/diheme cytochrome c family protein
LASDTKTVSIAALLLIFGLHRWKRTTGHDLQRVNRSTQITGWGIYLQAKILGSPELSLSKRRPRCIMLGYQKSGREEPTMRAVLSIFVLVAALTVSATAPAQQSVDFGKLEYEKSCLGCHGVGAKGGGVHTPHLKSDPPDLTVLAKANGGVFPIQKIYEVIDGRAQVQAHGPREMPIWGKEYTIPAVPDSTEAVVRNRILWLIDYLYRIQEKLTEDKLRGNDIGAREYSANCAVCHGLQGRGDGTYASLLNMPVT